MYAARLFCFSVFALFYVSSATYPACGGTDGREMDSLAENINNHLKGLKQRRREGYGWTNTPAVALSIQLVQPASFSALNETIARASDELNVSLANITLGRLSQYILMIKSVCHDPSNFDGRDLDALLTMKLNDEFSRGGIRHRSPRNGWYGFFLGLQAFCVSGSNVIDHFYIERALHGQNHNGSFGKGVDVDLTAQALLSLECLSRKNNLQNHQLHSINQAAERASKFLLSRSVTERNKVWIGNKYSSPYAVLAIKEHSKWAENVLLCSLVMNSLNLPTKAEEPEAAMAQRLLALKGVTFLEILNEDYHCNTPDLAPDEPRPSYEDSVIPCQEDASQSLTSLPPVMINVRITTDRGKKFTNGESRLLDITLTAVPKGKTLLEILRMAECRKLISFETQTTSWGEYVTSMNGKMAKSANREYWHISNNGRSLNVGVSQFKPSHDDRIVFRLKKWKR